MKKNYLFIDGWADLSIITENNRNNQINPIVLIVPSIIKKSNNIIKYIDARDNGFSKKMLLSTITHNSIDNVIFYCDIDNLESVLRFIRCNKECCSKFFLFSINDSMAQYMDISHVKTLLYDERIDIESNIKSIVKNLCLSIDNEKIDNFQIDYSIVKDIHEKTVLINTGSGCKRRCEFCSICNSIVVYRGVNEVINEIAFLLNSGVKNFHITNHFFANNRFFVKELCEILIKDFSKYDYIWSCFIIPEYYISHIDLLPLMKKAKLRKIELGCESGSLKILKYFNISSAQEAIMAIISKAIEVDIPVISTHFIIGSPLESKQTLKQTENFILKILRLTNSYCDIYLHSYFEKNKDISFYRTLLRKKNDFIFNTKYLKISDLKNLKKQIQKRIQLERKDLFFKVPIQKQYEQIKMSSYGVNTQVYINNIFHSPLNIIYKRKEQCNYIYFSWEIEKNIDDYSPELFVKMHLTEEKLKDDFSNIKTFLLNNMTKGLTVRELSDWVSRITFRKFGKDDIISILNILESESKLFYTKYLK